MFDYMIAGVVFAQRATVLLHILPLEKMPVMFGVLQAANSDGLTTGRPLGGKHFSIFKFKSIEGIYKHAFFKQFNFYFQRNIVAGLITCRLGYHEHNY